MSDETENRPAKAFKGKGHSGGGDGLSSPLQTRAAFFKNWDWVAVVSINRGACERGKAQHGVNSETGAACAADWEKLRLKTLALEETFDLLCEFHRRAPFFFFNGNTFATIGRELSVVLFSDLPPVRRREAASAVAHYIAGVLDRESMVAAVTGLCESAAFKAGDRVKTLRGSTRGVVVKILRDGQVVWQPDGSKSKLKTLPESLTRQRR